MRKEEDGKLRLKINQALKHVMNDVSQAVSHGKCCTTITTAAKRISGLREITAMIKDHLPSSRKKVFKEYTLKKEITLPRRDPMAFAPVFSLPALGEITATATI